MKFAVSSDWHIGAGTMDSDIESSVMQMVGKFRDNRVDMIAIPGDFFDHKSTAEGRNLLRRLIQELCSVAPVIGVRGNHDQDGDLDIFSHLEVANPVAIYDSPFIISLPGIVMHLLPWMTKATWQAQNISKSKEEGDFAVSQLALQYLKNNVMLENSREKGLKHILISHLLINGSRLQNQQPLMGEGITFGANDLSEAGFYAGIFGHIHLNQSFDENGRFFYPGSPAPMNYGESPEKYCVILNTDTGVVEWHKLNTIDRFSIECVWPLGVSMSPEEFQAMKDRAKGSRVRVLLKIDEGENLSYAKEEIDKILMDAGALEVKVDPQVRPKDLVRAVEISKAETLEAKLEAYWEASNNRPDDETVLRMKSKLSIVEGRCR